MTKPTRPSSPSRARLLTRARPPRVVKSWWSAAAWSLALVVGGLLAYFVSLVMQAPGPGMMGAARKVPEPSVLLAADGKVLMRLQREQQRPVTLEQISPHVVHALIATEDHRFYQHKGINWLRTVKAVWRTAAGRTEGGSTITQQLARNLYPQEIGRARNVERKIKEMVTARRIERVYDKRRILETYLNTAPFLYNAVGIEMAARTYFSKSAAELDEVESATLVGMLKGTHYYNPLLHPERALERRNLVLAQMVRRGFLPQAEYDRLKARPVQVRFNRQPDEVGLAPHFAMHVRKWLFAWAEEHDYDLYRDGLVVETTLDSRLQEAATKAVEQQAGALQRVADVEWSQSYPPLAARSPEAYQRAAAAANAFAYYWRTHPEVLQQAVRDSDEYRQAVERGEAAGQVLARLMADEAFIKRVKAAKARLEAGLVAIEPATGEVKAWVGSREFERDQYDHVAQAVRQPGSTFKPIVYGAALEQGIPPSRVYADVPIAVPLTDGTVWQPTNASGYSGRYMTLWEGLVYSKNTITARVGQEVGLHHITGLAEAMGIERSRLDPVPSMVLGTSPVTLLEMASVYATIANGGERQEPLLVRRIKDHEGRVVEEFTSGRSRALSFASAMSLIDMMRGVVSHGTAGLVRTGFQVSADIAGKTGTTQNNTDGWFIAMHPQLVVGSWVGFNDQRVTMRSNYWGQGGHNALRLVGDFLHGALQRRLLDPQATFPTPQQAPITAAVYAAQPGVWDLSEGETPSDSIVQDPAGMAGAPQTEPIVVIQGNLPPTGAGISGASGASAEPPKSEEELNRAMRAWGMEAHGGGTAAAVASGASRISEPAPVPVPIPVPVSRPAATVPAAAGTTARDDLADLIGAPPQGQN